MSRTRLGLLALAVIGLVACALYAVPNHRPEWKAAPDSTARFPKKLPNRFYVSERDERAIVQYHEDNRTPRLAVVDMPNGLIVEISYDLQGVRTSDLVFYPSQIPMMERGPKRQESTYDTDGKTYLADKVFFRSGAVFQAGKLEAQDRYVKEFFFPDGKSRRREVHMRVASTWHLHWAEEVTAEGKLHETYRTLTDGTMQLRRYKPNGKVFVKVTKVIGNATPVETWYQDDGKTPAFEVIREDWRTTVTTFARNGKLKLVERAFIETYGTSALEVTYLDRRNRKTFTQRWVKDEGVYKLNAINTFYPNETDKRLISWDKDPEGKIYLNFEQIFLSSREDVRPSRSWYYNADGRLSKYERSWGNYLTDKSWDYPEGKGRFRPVWIEPKLKRVPSYILPPPAVLDGKLEEPPIN